MSSTLLHQVSGKCTLQYNYTVDGISVVCSICSRMLNRAFYVADGMLCLWSFQIVKPLCTLRRKFTFTYRTGTFFLFHSKDFNTTVSYIYIHLGYAIYSCLAINFSNTWFSVQLFSSSKAKTYLCSIPLVSFFMTLLSYSSLGPFCTNSCLCSS